LAEFQNPQQEPGTERRLLLAFALVFVGMFAYQLLMKKYGPPPPEPKAETTQTAQSAKSQMQPPATEAASLPAAGSSATNATEKKQAQSEAEIVVENDYYRIVFTNRGARVKSWVLKKYKAKPDGNELLDLVNHSAADKFGYPLSLWTYDETVRNKVNSALYVPTGSGSQAPSEIGFDYADGELSVHKSFKFDRSYVVEAKTSVEWKGLPIAAFPMWPEGFGDQSTAPAFAASQIAYQNDGKVERLANSWTVLPSIKAVGGATISGPFQWAAVSDQYFTAAFIPQDPASAAMVTLRNTFEVPHDPTDKNTKMDKVDVFGIAVGSQKGPSAVRLYVGPKALPELESVSVPSITGAEPDLRAIPDFGWLGYIARPLFLWLKWTYNHIVPNWGWAIVIQTIIINLALLPLRISQTRSMLKMQRIAPQIKAIQEKYKKLALRERNIEVNQAVAALYKKEGVNPVGGCLPLLIQMPFLFAYYRMLAVAIDLRHASWLWVRDLSAPEQLPIHILPIFVIVSMLIMQRMTPQGGMDPAQQKMMNIMMPAMLGLISWNLASGLCLYWSMGNVIGIVQQSIMNRTKLGREMREMMEKRARKKEK
jgi:YidC/Oxa1 family membrane protein insertase